MPIKQVTFCYNVLNHFHLPEICKFRAPKQAQRGLFSEPINLLYPSAPTFPTCPPNAVWGYFLPICVAPLCPRRAPVKGPSTPDCVQTVINTIFGQLWKYSLEMFSTKVVVLQSNVYPEYWIFSLSQPKADRQETLRKPTQQSTLVSYNCDFVLLEAEIIVMYCFYK